MLAGAVVLQAVALALLIRFYDPAPPRPPAAPALATESAGPRPVPRVDVIPDEPRTPLSGGGWRVVDQMSAHYMLVLEVETERLADARQIAQTLVEPLKDRYVEALVYFRRPGTQGTLPARRVQWTKAGGYVEVNYEEAGAGR